MPAAFELENHRSAVFGHCYRMLGSSVDADDAVQETMVRAWRALESFDGRSALRTWLHSIATRVCLDALADRKRRLRPMEDAPPGGLDDPLEAKPRSHWLEPVPEQLAIPADSDPAERAQLRQSVRLAFVAALQHLPPKQRAALLLSEVLGWSAEEVASDLETTIPAVNSALQRARATLAAPRSSRAEPSPAQLALVDRYQSAFERYDIDELSQLLRHDAILSMPPYGLWLQGAEQHRAWLLGRGSVCKDSRLLPIEASGSPAFAQYHRVADGTYQPWSILVLELDEESVTSHTFFLDTEALFPLFGLPSQLEP